MLPIEVNIFKFDNLRVIISNAFNFKSRRKLTRDTVRILFVDDNKMPIVDNLKKAGFDVKKIKDANNIQIDEIQTRHVIFIDYEGVGRSMSPEHQGAGLARQIKKMYGEKKYVVLYTSQLTIPSDTAMLQIINAADERLKKNSDSTDFENVISRALDAIRI